MKKEIEDLNKKLEECQKKQAEYLAGWQRARADFLNYKKEEMEKLEEILKYANQGFILEILPILDNLEMAEEKLPEELKKDENFKGILQIKNQVLTLLKNQGIEEIETKGKKFDPNFQEAIAEEKKEGLETGTIIEETQKGYLLNGKVIRPAKVKVAK